MAIAAFGAFPAEQSERNTKSAQHAMPGPYAHQLLANDEGQVRVRKRLT